MTEDESMILNAFLLGLFALYTWACWRLKISYRLSMMAGLMLLGVSAILTGGGASDVANLAAILAYCFLAVGVTLAVLDTEGRKQPVDAAANVKEHPRAGMQEDRDP